MIKFKIIFLFFLSLSYLKSTVDFLVFEKDPLSNSLGGGNEILGFNRFFNRNYTSQYSLKEKTEINFFYNTLPFNNLSTQGFSFGWPRPFLDYFLFGAYGYFINFGNIRSFNESKAKGSLGNFSDLYVGAPIIVDYDQIVSAINNFNNPNQSFNSTFLKKFNTAINVNYYQAQFEGITSQTIFFDLNASSRFQVPYLGKPAKLITKDDLKQKFLEQQSKIENKSIYEIAQTQRKLINEENEILKLKLQLQKETKQKINTLKQELKKSQNNLEKIYQIRKKIYSTRVSLNDEIQDEDISNYAKKAKEEFSQRTQNLQKNIEKTYKAYIYKIISMIVTNERYIEKHKSNLLSSITNKEKNNINTLFQLYQNSFSEKENNQTEEKIIKKYQNSKKKIKITQKNFIEDWEIYFLKIKINRASRQGFLFHEVKKKETIKNIIKKYFKSRLVYSLVVEENKDLLFKKINPGQKIKIFLKQLMLKQKKKEQEMTQNIQKTLHKIRKNSLLNSLQEAYLKNIISFYQKKKKNYFLLEEFSTTYENKQKSFEKKKQVKIKNLENYAKQFYKKLKKKKLKKQYNILNSISKKEKEINKRAYKKEENQLLEKFFVNIHDVQKKSLNWVFQEALITKKTDDFFIQKSYQDKINAIKKEYVLSHYIKNQSSAKEATEQLNENKNKEKQLVKKEKENALEKKKLLHSQIISKIKSEIYFNDLIYLGSTQEIDSLATGFFIKNLGFPIKIQSIDEPLPIEFGFDINYTLYKNHHRYIILYNNYGYSYFHNFKLGIGARYGFFENMEILSGLSHSFKGLEFSSAFLINFPFSLVDYQTIIGFNLSLEYENQFHIAIQAVF